MRFQTLFLLGVSLSALLQAPGASGQGITGTITGTVIDSASRTPLPGAAVRLRGANFVAVTDLNGAFVLGKVPSGPQHVDVTYLGYKDGAAPVDVAGDGYTVLEVALDRASVKEQVIVTAEPILAGQAKALNQQKSAPNVVNVVAADQIESFPDRNSAEALQRLPGILLERDQGEGRYVVVRGTEARLNYTSLDGSQIPSPEGDVRLVALDVVPADSLASIEVSKTLTPDMDGDAIGGAINLVTRTAPAKAVFNVQAGIGFNDIRADLAETGNLGLGRRSADGRVGLLLAGSALNTDRGSDNFEVSYDDGELEELEYRAYTINRKRYGGNLALDFEPSGSSELVLRGNYFDFRDQEYRRRVRNEVSDGRLERELKDRFEDQEIYGGSFTGNHLLPGFLQLDYKVSYLGSGESEPDAFYSTFRQEDVAFAPNVSPDAIDPDNIQANPQNEDIGAYLLDDLVSESNRTTENNFAVRANVGIPLPSAESFGGLLKFGGNYRDKAKKRDNNATAYDIEDDLALLAVPETEGIRDIIEGRYPIGLFQDAPSMIGLTGILEGEHLFEEDLADYQADETVWAGYGMAELFLGENLSLSAGVRYENTSVDYRGFELIYDEEGEFLSLTERQGSRNYGEVLPMVNVRYRLAPETFLRAAATRTFARPNYVDLTPSRLILQEDLEIEQGNPNLDPTTAWNFDLMFEKYLPSVGAIAAGGFYKDLKDYVYRFRFDEDFQGETYEVTQPLNGESAQLWGVEVAVQAPLRFLPKPFDGLGIYANYTWTDSEAFFPDRDTPSTLPGQAKNVGNFGIFYELGGFTGRVALNLAGRYISEVGGDASEDLFVDSRTQLDLAFAQRITPEIQLYIEFLNLTDQPFRTYVGSPNRPVQEEYYSWWGMFGVRLTL